jgi:hypothetical protein
MPNVFECTYVHKKYLQNSFIKLNTNSIPSSLDMPNFKDTSEIFLNYPPFVNKLNITIFGSCRQNSIYKLHNVSSIQEKLSYPHYTKEILQVINFCKFGNLSPLQTLYTFRTPMLNKIPLGDKDIEIFKREFENTDIFILEIASKKCYKYKDIYVHHIAEEPEYNSGIITDIEKRSQNDQEIENDIIEIKNIINKPIIIVSHLVTYDSGDRFNLSNLLENVCKKHNIMFLNPVKELKKNLGNFFDTEKLFKKENTIAHYTDYGNEKISEIYRDFINNI